MAWTCPARSPRRRPRAASASRSAPARSGIAGVAGNGQNELLLALSGERTSRPTPRSGSTAPRSPGRHPDGARLCSVPEERNGHAAVPEMSLVDNGVLSGRRRQGFLAGGFIRAGKARDFASQVVKRIRRPHARHRRAGPQYFRGVCRSSWSAARCCRTPACSSSRSPPGAWTPAPPPPFTRR